MKKSRKRHSYEVALAGICTAIILLFLWLSVLVRYGTISFFIICCGILMLPLSKKYYWSAIFAWIASSLLAFAIVGDIFAVLGFLAYFAPMTIGAVIMKEKKVPWWVALVVKTIFINAMLAVFYFATNLIAIDLSAMGLGDLHYAVIAVVGTLILLAVDYLMLLVYGGVKKRFAPIIKDGQQNEESTDETKNSDKKMWNLKKSKKQKEDADKDNLNLSESQNAELSKNAELSDNLSNDFNESPIENCGSEKSNESCSKKKGKTKKENTSKNFDLDESSDISIEDVFDDENLK